MGKKNKYKKDAETAKVQEGAAPSPPQQQQQQQTQQGQQGAARPQQQPQQQQSSGHGQQPQQQQKQPQHQQQQPQQQQWRQQQPQQQQWRQQQPQSQGQQKPQQQWGKQQQQQPHQQQRGQHQQQQQWGKQQQQQGQQQPHQQQRGQQQQQQQWGKQQQQQGQRQPHQQQQWGQQQPHQQQQQQQRQQSGTSATGAVPKGRQQQPQQQHYQQQQPQQYRSPSTSSSISASSSTSAVGGIKRGTEGKRGEVEVNYLQLNLDKLPKVGYHYDVTMTPDRPKKYLRQAFEQFKNQCFKDIAIVYDGSKSCYSIAKLEKDEYEKEVEIADANGRNMKFKVAIKLTSDPEVELSSLKTYFKDRIFDKPMRAMQMLEVILSYPCQMRGLRVGRSFFMRPERKVDLDDGYELWFGLYQAVILGDLPFLNVDIAHKSFPSGCNLIDYIRNNHNRCDINKGLDSNSFNDIQKFIKGINVIYTPPKSSGMLPKVFKVHGMSDASAGRLKFKDENGKELSIQEYFHNKYGYNLRYPNLNCLHVGSLQKKIYIPMELCDIQPGQAINKKDESRQVQKIIKYAATSTNERKKKIMDMLRYMAHNVDPMLKIFGLQIGADFIKVPMRILFAPEVEYFKNERILPRNGQWRFGNGTKFLKTTPGKEGGHKWSIIYSNKSRYFNYNDANQFGMGVLNEAKKLNVSLLPKPEIQAFDNVDDTLGKLKRENYDLVFVVLPNFGTTYAKIKQSAELKHGVLTQCIKEDTIKRRCNPQTIGNILLKVNAKLNGANHKIVMKGDMPLKNVMFLGADVTHPSPDQREIPSVVGVAASHDADGACYNMQYRLQKSTLEEIEDMDKIVENHFRVYFKYQNRYPDHIIYYRDGVSDGQFPKIRQKELRGIRAACDKLRIRPKLTCVIVVKRHHTRFFPAGEPDQYNKFNNVAPGTVVDRVIVHPNEVQFFMVSHQAIQGTAKPTRYNVLEDDAKLDIDLLQKLTYNMCHMFPRCNRAVSYPAPAYLAHLVAFRGRVYLEGEYNFKELNKEYEKRLVNPAFMERSPMYFV